MTTNIPTPWLNSLEGVRPTTLEYKQESTYQMLKNWALEKPNNPFIIFPKGKILNFADTLNEVKQLSVQLKALGVEKGDRIAVDLPNVPQYIISHFAIMSLGAIIVQTNPLYTERELIHQMNDSGAKGIISLTLFQEKIEKIMPDTNLEFCVMANISDYLKPIITILGKLTKKLIDPKFVPKKGFFLYKDLMKTADSSKFNEEVVNLDDVTLLQYTGGTTGLSKGAMLTHRNISCNAQQARSIIHHIPDGTGSVLTALPLFHSFALTICLGNSLAMGTSMVLLPKFNVEDALSLVEKYKITFFPGVPTMLIAMMSNKKFETIDLSSVIGVLSGGAALPLEVAREFEAKTGGSIVEGYGLSETSPVTNANPLGSTKLAPRIGTVGPPVADTFVKIVDVNDYSKMIPVGQEGEICLKGPQIFKGYWNNETATKEVLKEDGWFLTGDIGKLDEDGFLSIVDRKKELIIVSGNNVVPREVEEVIYTHPAVLEVAVAGLKDRNKGEIVAAWVVLKENKEATESELIDFCAKSLAPYKIPKKVTFKKELPKSMIGKILKRKILEQEEAN
ncbi:MAG: long-chain fatty acid--CoA ligase [Candidatus Heimdallarchaeota archaeon]|nr:long-chain fatty acid--CoA ligase [Candidatus Heimdallarchaeota archaeon]